MHYLVVPFALPCFQIDAHQTLGKKIVARPVPAVPIRRRRLHRQVDQAQILVDRELSPDTGVAVDSPRAVLPGLAAELAGLRNRVEGPQAPAGPHIEGAYESF